MVFFGGVKLVLALTLAFAVLDESVAQNSIRTCYETWSECTMGSSFATGKLWETCAERCKSLGHRNGDCAKVNSNLPVCDNAWQCKCSD